MLERRISEELIQITGKKRFLDEPEALLSYAYDAFTREVIPEAVLLPTSPVEVSEIMKIASREKIARRGHQYQRRGSAGSGWDHPVLYEDESDFGGEYTGSLLCC